MYIFKTLLNNEYNLVELIFKACCIHNLFVHTFVTFYNTLITLTNTFFKFCQVCIRNKHKLGHHKQHEPIILYCHFYIELDFLSAISASLSTSFRFVRMTDPTAPNMTEVNIAKPCATIRHDMRLPAYDTQYTYKCCILCSRLVTDYRNNLPLPPT